MLIQSSYKCELYQATQVPDAFEFVPSKSCLKRELDNSCGFLQIQLIFVYFTWPNGYNFNKNFHDFMIACEVFLDPNMYLIPNYKRTVKVLG